MGSLPYFKEHASEPLLCAAPPVAVHKSPTDVFFGTHLDALATGKRRSRRQPSGRLDVLAVGKIQRLTTTVHSGD